MTFPVVVPCHPKDFSILPRCSESVRKFVDGACPFFVISAHPMATFLPRTWNSERYWLSEDYAPTLDEVTRLLPPCGECPRWYRQQLLKLLAPVDAPRWLQVDADIIFQRPVSFVDAEGRALFSPYCGPHFHRPYFDHMARLVPGLLPQTTQSLISHHVVYDRDILASLIAEVEAHHKRPFWEAYLACVDPEWVTRSGAAENELYSHYALWRFPERVRVRQLAFADVGTADPRPDLDFIGVQSYLRPA